MRIIFDARMVSLPFTGLGRFSGELLIGLLKLAKLNEDKYLVIIWNQNLLHNKYIKILYEFRDQGICEIIVVNFKPVGISQHFKLKKYLNDEYGDIYIHPHFDLPIFSNIPSICILHDLFPIKVKGYMLRNTFLKKIYFRLMLRIIARKSKYIFAVSETTKKDYIEEVGPNFITKVGVCLEGPIVRVDSNFVEKKILNNNYLLYAGDRRPHKNIKKIIDLFKLLKICGYGGSLILVGSTKNYDFDVDSYVKDVEGVKILGQIDDADLLNLYLQMDALVFLSKYEGFGLPVVEAALLGKRIIVSNGGALNEVSPKWAYRLSLDSDIAFEAPKILEYIRAIPQVEKGYGNNYRWDSVAKLVNLKMTELFDISNGR